MGAGVKKEAVLARLGVSGPLPVLEFSLSGVRVAGSRTKEEVDGLMGGAGEEGGGVREGELAEGGEVDGEGECVLG